MSGPERPSLTYANMCNVMTLRFSICAEMIFPELSFGERIEKIAGAGFEGIEFWSWRDKSLDTLVSRCAELGLIVTNMSGQRAGSLVDPREFEMYKSEVAASIGAAQRISCENLMLLTNPLGPNGEVLNAYPEIPPQRKRSNCERALSRLALLATGRNISLLVEPLNTVIDHSGYWLDDADCAFELIRAVDHPGIRLLYDLYHMRAMGRDVCKDIEGNLDLIGYFHAADFPGRHEPGAGQMDYASILRLLDSLGYDGFVGFEFSPASSSEKAIETIHRLVAPYL